MSFNIYVLRGKTPVIEEDLTKWGMFMSNGDLRRVKLDVIGKSTVSTVFLGLDHNFIGGKPLLFETMVFPGDNCWRTSTWDEAVKTHETVCKSIKAHDKVCKELKRTVKSKEKSEKRR